MTDTENTLLQGLLDTDFLRLVRSRATRPDRGITEVAFIELVENWLARSRFGFTFDDRQYGTQELREALVRSGLPFSESGRGYFKVVLPQVVFHTHAGMTGGLVVTCGTCSTSVKLSPDDLVRLTRLAGETIPLVEDGVRQLEIAEERERKALEVVAHAMKGRLENEGHEVRFSIDGFTLRMIIRLPGERKMCLNMTAPQAERALPTIVEAVRKATEMITLLGGGPLPSFHPTDSWDLYFQHEWQLFRRP